MDRKVRYILYILFFIAAVCTRTFILRSVLSERSVLDRKAKPLQDSMHSIIPKISEEIGKIKELTTFVPFLIFLFYILREKNYRVLFDFVKLFAMILFIRSLSFYLTMLPDASERCDPEATGINGGCNDLLFSGHTSFQILSLLYLYYYSETWNKYPNTIKIPFLSLIPINAYLILATRDHYSIDILYALIVSYSMFYFNHTCFKPGMLCVQD
jgi:hypothetical protein